MKLNFKKLFKANNMFTLLLVVILVLVVVCCLRKTSENYIDYAAIPCHKVDSDEKNKDGSPKFLAENTNWDSNSQFGHESCIEYGSEGAGRNDRAASLGGFVEFSSMTGPVSAYSNKMADVAGVSKLASTLYNYYLRKLREYQDYKKNDPGPWKIVKDGYYVLTGIDSTNDDDDGDDSKKNIEKLEALIKDGTMGEVYNASGWTDEGSKGEKDTVKDDVAIASFEKAIKLEEAVKSKATVDAASK
jgi:hypothetical protein